MHAQQQHVFLECSQGCVGFGSGRANLRVGRFDAFRGSARFRCARSLQFGVVVRVVSVMVGSVCVASVRFGPVRVGSVRAASVRCSAGGGTGGGMGIRGVCSVRSESVRSLSVRLVRFLGGR